MYTESTACLHDTVSCQQGYLGLLTYLGLVSTHHSHCLCTRLLNTTSSLHTFTAHNTSIRDCTQMSCPLLVKMPSPAQPRHAGALRDDIQPVSFQINGRIPTPADTCRARLPHINCETQCCRGVSSSSTRVKWARRPYTAKTTAKNPQHHRHWQGSSSAPGADEYSRGMETFVGWHDVLSSQAIAPKQRFPLLRAS